MNGLKKLAGAALSGYLLSSNAEAADQFNTDKEITEPESAFGEMESIDDGELSSSSLTRRCTTDVSTKELRELSEEMRSDLKKALNVTPDDLDGSEKKQASEFLKMLRAMPISKIKSRLDAIDSSNNLEDTQTLWTLSLELIELNGEIEAYRAQLLEHLSQNSSGSYDIYGFTPDSGEIMKKDVTAVFDNYAEKGISCDEHVRNFVVEFGIFPGKSWYTGNLLDGMDDKITDSKEILGLMKSSKKNTEDRSRDKVDFSDRLEKTVRNLDELIFMKNQAISKIKERYQF